MPRAGDNEQGFNVTIRVSASVRMRASDRKVRSADDIPTADETHGLDMRFGEDRRKLAELEGRHVIEAQGQRVLKAVESIFTEAGQRPGMTLGLFTVSVALQFDRDDDMQDDVVAFRSYDDEAHK